jgi:hypothetical protein
VDATRWRKWLWVWALASRITVGETNTFGVTGVAKIDHRTVARNGRLTAGFDASFLGEDAARDFRTAAFVDAEWTQLLAEIVVKRLVDSPSNRSV